MPAPPQRSVAAVKSDQAWRGRTLIAAAVLAAGVVVFGAVNVDWNEGLAMALGQLAGLLSPVAVLGAVVWGAAAHAGRKR